MKIKYVFVFLCINLIISIVMIISLSIKSKIKSPFENILALYEPSKYLKRDTLKIDTIIERTHRNSGKNSTETSIIGILLSSKEKKEIFYGYKDDAYKKFLKDDKGVSYLYVVRNILNNDIFIEEYRFINFEKRNSILQIYFICSPIFILFIIVLYLKKMKK